MRWMLVDEPPTELAEGDAPAPGDGAPADAPTECPEGQHLDPDTGECVPDEAAPEAAPEASVAGRFRSLLVVEDTWSGDGRVIRPDALTWRDLPLPMMGLDSTTEGHDEAELIGSIDSIVREGINIYGEGPWAATPFANRIRAAVRGGHLRGVSADMDDVEWELIVPPGDDDVLLIASAGDRGADDVEGEVIPMPELKQRVTAARIIGATVVPFPAFQECFIEDLNPEVALEDAIVAAGVTPPTFPPESWFADPDFGEYVPVTVTDDGEVFGHIADWSSCHIGYADRCVPPPRSATDYAHFHVGECPTAEGTRVPVGHITLRGGHAPLSYSPAAAQSFYDDTRSCVADVRAGEDEFGIWVHGALRPEVTPSEVRSIMASGVSGDWRRLGGTLEMINVAQVNVPGFRSVRVREQAGLVASMIVDFPPAARTVEGLSVQAFDSIVERIALSVGRGRAVRLAALHARVHPQQQEVSV